MFIKDLKIARLIGKGDFDRAIEILTRSLKNSESDVFTLETIAMCHQSAGRVELAIQAAYKAYELDSTSFGAVSKLGELHASLGRHHEAIQFVRAGLAIPQQQIPPTPKFVLKIFNALARVFPRLKGSLREAEMIANNPDMIHQPWLDWAHKYVEWYENTYDEESGPAKH